MSHRLRKCISAALASIILLGSTPKSMAAGFTDVPTNAWYAQAAEYTAEAGLFSGVGGNLFAPDVPMSRAMFVTVLAQHCGNYADAKRFYNMQAPEPFQDVFAGAWYGEAVSWANCAKLVSGKTPETFAPNDAVTRQEAAVFLYTYAQRTGNDLSHTGTSLAQFTDAPFTAAWARDAMDWAVEHHLFSGLPDGTLSPGKTLTRAEAAVVFWQARKVLTSNHIAYPMTDTAAALGFTADTYPRLDGASSLIGRIHEAMFGSLDPNSYSGLAASYQKLAAGEVDLLLVPDAPEDVLQLANGIDLEAVELARTGLVFYTFSENSADSLTVEQLRSIYRENAVENWSEIGGPDKPLAAIATSRETDSDRYQLDRMILQGSALAPEIEANNLVDENRKVLYFAALGHTFTDGPFGQGAYCLGYDVFHADQNRADLPKDSLKSLKIEGIAPTDETIANGSYPLTYSLYAVTRADLPEDHPARKLIIWLQTAEGRKYLASSEMVTVW